MWILEFELLDGPPGGGSLSDMIAPACRHPRVEMRYLGLVHGLYGMSL